MSERNWSTSDRFIFVMGELQKMEYATEDPYRFAKNSMKQAAEKVLYEACITASQIIQASKAYDQAAIEASLNKTEAIPPK